MTIREIIFLLLVCGAVVAWLAMSPAAPRDIELASRHTVDWRQVKDDPSQTLTMSWCTVPIFPAAGKDTWIQRRLEKTFNVRFEPVFDDVFAYNNRRNLMLAAGDISDVQWDGDPLGLQRNAHQGIALEIPYDLILRHAPTYVKYVNQFGPEAWLYTRYKGRNYGIPTFAASDVFGPVALWRQDWLDAVGLHKPPETLADMHEAFRRFRYNDPDGNGVKDTYGACPDIMWWAVFFQDVFSAYGLLPQDWQERDGKVAWGGIDPRAKEALALLRAWHEEDLFDPDFAAASFANNPAQLKFPAGRLGYHPSMGSWDALDLANENSVYSKMKRLNPRAVLTPGKPLLGADGQRRTRVWGGPAHIIWFNAALADRQPQKVIRVLDMFERYATDGDLFIESRIGRRGKHWEYSPRRGVTLMPEFQGPGAEQRNLISLGALENAYGFFSPCSVPLQMTAHLLPEGADAFRRTYSDSAWGMKNALGKSDVLPSAATYLEDLRLFQLQAYMQIIRGERPLEYFDEFVRTWRARGGDILTREANEFWKERNEIFRIVGALPK